MKVYQVNLLDFDTGEYSEFVGVFDTKEKAEAAVKAVGVMLGVEINPDEVDIDEKTVNYNFLTQEAVND